MASNLLNKKIIFPLLILYLVCMFILCIADVDPKQQLANMHIAGVRGDDFLHIFGCMPLIPMLWFGLPDKARIRKPLFLFFIGLAIAASLESIQLFIPYRHFGFDDMLANCIGVVLGSFVFLFKRKPTSLPQ